MIAKVSQQLFSLWALTRFQHHEGFPHLAPFRIGDADHRTLEYRRVSVQHRFDFRRIHIFAAGNEHILEPVNDIKAPVFVITGQIARMKPAIAINNLCPGSSVVEVAGGDAGTFQHQFANLVGSQRTVVAIDDSRINEKVGAANAPGFANGVFRGQCE